MAGEIIRQGDSTSHGGTVVEGSINDICHGKPIAYIGHKVSCPQCKGTYPIVEGAMTSTFYGKGVALAGMKTACGATLIATQFTDMVEVGGGAASGAAAAELGAAASNAVAPSAASAVAGAATSAARSAGAPSSASPDVDDAVKKVTAISWSYGPQEKPVSGPARFFVDLNLHVSTENYADGEMVEIVLEDDEGNDVLEGVKILTLRAPVDADGKAKLLNALAGKTVITLAQAQGS